MPGIGFGGNPHGHTSIEFGDDLGNFYSVGMYMDPRSRIDTKKAPAATVRGVLMSPDPYLPSSGEKSVHRYSLGSGEEGQAKVARLKKHIEKIQSWTKDPETGIVRTCPVKYHAFKYNCGDFQEDIEKFTSKELGGKLAKLDDDSVFVPFRHRVSSKSSWFTDIKTTIWHRFLLFLVDTLIYLVIANPFLAKKMGAGKEDDFSDFEPQVTHGEVQKGIFGFLIFATKNIKSLAQSMRPRSVKFPRRVRLEQLYSPRLKRYSALLKTD